MKPKKKKKKRKKESQKTPHVTSLLVYSQERITFFSLFCLKRIMKPGVMDDCTCIARLSGHWQRQNMIGGRMGWLNCLFWQPTMRSWRVIFIKFHSY